MPGAAAVARSYQGRNRVAHPKPGKTTVTSQSATAIRGGTGPVRQDKVSNPALRGT